MDVTKQKEQFGKLEKRVADLVEKERQVQVRLDGEHQIIRAAASARATAVGKLSDANAEEAVRLNKEVDVLDARTKNAERLAEAHQASLKQIAAEVQAVAKERDALGQQIAQVENEKAFASERENLERGFADLGEMLVIVRERMADLNTKAASFGERFRGPGYNVIAPLFETFLRDQANQDQRGFRFVYGYRQDFRVILNPMVPR